MSSAPRFVLLIQRFYDKVLLLVALLLLAWGVLVLAGGKQREKGAEANFFAGLDSLQAAHPTAVPVALTGYSNALVRLSRPYRIAIDTNQTAGFFVPETRVWCANHSCTALLPQMAKVCSICGTEQPLEPTDDPNYDSDGGGCPDWWEIKYGFDPHDPADDRIDSDGDGFDNYTEYLAGTDPTDPKSHPDLLELVRVERIETTRLPIKFMAATRLPNGKYRCQINLLSEDGRGGMTHFVQEGEGIGKTDMKLVRYIETQEKRISKVTNSEMTFTIKKIEIERDGKRFMLGIDEDSIEGSYRIILQQTLDKSRIEVAGDGKIVIGDKTYRVISVDKQASTIVLRSDADEKEITIPKLEDNR